jgi:signal transduction histidine kinase
MSPPAGKSRFADVLARLQAGPDALAVSDRRDLVKAIADALRGGDSQDKALVQLLYQLAGDSKWEVRQDLADILPLVPDEHFAALAAQLVQDDNRYVRTAAERSMERRRKTEAEAERTSRGMAQITSRFESFAKRHGESAAADAMQLSEEHLEMVGKEIAHDLLNLLTPLKEYAKALQSGMSGNQAGSEAAARIAEGVELLHRSVRDIQTYCEPVSVDRHMEKMDDLIRTADGLARANVKEDGGTPDAVALVADVATDIRLFVSRHAIIKAFMNILKNAYEACEAKTGQRKVSVRVAYAADSIHVSFEDTGVGLSDENLRKLKAY